MDLHEGVTTLAALLWAYTTPPKLERLKTHLFASFFTSSPGLVLGGVCGKFFNDCQTHSAKTAFN